MKWPSVDACIHAVKSCTPGPYSSPRLLAIRVDVVDLPVPRQPGRLDLVFLRIAMALAVNDDFLANGNHAVLETGLGGPGWRRKHDVPFVAFRVHLQRRVWSRHADGRRDGAIQIRQLVDVAAPAVMRRERQPGKKRHEHEGCADDDQTTN